MAEEAKQAARESREELRELRTTAEREAMAKAGLRSELTVAQLEARKATELQQMGKELAAEKEAGLRRELEALRQAGTREQEALQGARAEVEALRAEARERRASGDGVAAELTHTLVSLRQELLLCKARACSLPACLPARLRPLPAAPCLLLPPPVPCRFE